MNTGLPLYIPGSKVCRMPQYHCCLHRQQCRLWQRCAQIQFPTVCQRDCPSCTYGGCSLSAADRRSAPVYIKGMIQGDRSNPDLDTVFLKQQSEHRRTHIKRYEYYNTLFGDRRQRRNAQNRARYWADPEYYRMLARESYARCYKPHPKEIEKRFVPECGLKCQSCSFEDCILSEDWQKKAWIADFARRNPGYFERYRQEHRDARRAYNRQYYLENKETILEKIRQHRQKPEVKARRAEYDKAYRQTPAGKESARRRKQKYYEKNREKINERRRKNANRNSNANSRHCEV